MSQKEETVLPITAVQWGEDGGEGAVGVAIGANLAALLMPFGRQAYRAALAAIWAAGSGGVDQAKFPDQYRQFHQVYEQLRSGAPACDELLEAIAEVQEANSKDHHLSGPVVAFYAVEDAIRAEAEASAPK